MYSIANLIEHDVSYEMIGEVTKSCCILRHTCSSLSVCGSLSAVEINISQLSKYLGGDGSKLPFAFPLLVQKFD